MSFMYSYKDLDKLCKEIFGCSEPESGISAYIDEMYGISDGRYYVEGWESDLKRLKHYRWVRNKISHEPDCSEENMCERGDENWLKEFRSRIMSAKDPLALYEKAAKARAGRSKKKDVVSRRSVQHFDNKRERGSKGETGAGEGTWKYILIWAIIMLVIYAMIRIISFYPF